MAAAAKPLLFQGLDITVSYAHTLTELSLFLRNQTVCIQCPQPRVRFLCPAEENNPQHRTISSLAQMILISCLLRADACVAPVRQHWSWHNTKWSLQLSNQEPKFVTTASFQALSGNHPEPPPRKLHVGFVLLSKTFWS